MNQSFKRAVEELKEMIQKHFPTAQFSVYEGEDPHGIYLESVVDIDDIDQVMDVVVDRLWTCRSRKAFL